MSRYSVAEAKNTLPTLLDKAMAGEEVVITRHGKPIIVFKPVVAARRKGSAREADARLLAGRNAGPTLTFTSVELLKALHDESDF